MSRTIYTVRAKPRSALERSKIARPYRLNSVTTRVNWGTGRKPAQPLTIDISIKRANTYILISRGIFPVFAFGKTTEAKPEKATRHRGLSCDTSVAWPFWGVT